MKETGADFLRNSKKPAKGVTLMYASITNMERTRHVTRTKGSLSLVDLILTFGTLGDRIEEEDAVVLQVHGAIIS
jgi:hypothetical protein